MLGQVPEATGTLAWGKFSWLGLTSPIHEWGDDTTQGCVCVFSNKEKMAVSLCGVGAVGELLNSEGDSGVPGRSFHFHFAPKALHSQMRTPC